MLAATLVILLIECVGFNMTFWRTLGASTDSASYENTLGPGLKRTDTGMLRVSDPTDAWLEVKADGTSDYARVDTLTPKQDALHVIHLRATFRDASTPRSQGSASPNTAESTAATQSVAPRSPRSLYLYAPGSGVMRVWVEEAKGSVVPIQAVRANVRVPFSFSVTRVALMAGALLLVMAWRPGSRLWRIPLDTSSLRQRCAFAALAAPFAAVTAVNVVWQMRYAVPLSFHTPGGYTYDIDQYGHLADALLHGRVSLDLIVPDALAKAANPYDVGTRGRLLSEGVTPIYWDYAFHDGKWYSYFGVVPAVLLFAPYRALTGGMLSSAAAVHLLMFLALLFFWLLTVRVVARIAPRASLAATSMALAFVPLAGNFVYLVFRTNFYSVPFSASLAFTALGLWLWLGAQTTKRPLAPADRWRMEGAPELSLPRLGLGAACIALNFGCRPTFCLAALLGIPLFWPQIAALVANLKAGRTGWAKALRAPAVVVGAALVPLVPLLAYNHARFGSFLEFGNEYQLTVTDMTAFRQPAADVLPVFGYYLFLPPRFTGSFPFVALSPTPLPQWAFTEPLVGGLFTLCPLLLLAFAAPFLYRRGRRSVTPPVDGLPAMLTAALVLGLAMALFDGVSAGLGWRYMCDFGWLFALAALPGLLRVLDEPGACVAVADARPCRRAGGTRPPVPARVRAARIAVFTLMCWTLLFCLLACFTPGRQDQLLATNPAFFHDVLSWFRL
ncbi:hypothetical protein GFD21_08490 [Bifidobacterium sp. SMA15]|uniref:Glycosyltransferase n=2 Tax=Bifidobacterium platyrrhinorum TaxID=2661628 RepID=A0A6L9SW99_9BIFI|nr:hypothetical protein [Bifidobacterium platyrrhinorum]